MKRAYGRCFSAWNMGRGTRTSAAIAACLSVCVASGGAFAGKGSKRDRASTPAANPTTKADSGVLKAATLVAVVKIPSTEPPPSAAKPLPFNPFMMHQVARGSSRPASTGGGGAASPASALQGAPRPTNVDTSPQRREHLERTMNERKRELASVENELPSAESQVRRLASELRSAERAVEIVEEGKTLLAGLHLRKASKQGEIDEARGKLEALPRESSKKARSSETSLHASGPRDHEASPSEPNTFFHRIATAWFGPPGGSAPSERHELLDEQMPRVGEDKPRISFAQARRYQLDATLSRLSSEMRKIDRSINRRLLENDGPSVETLQGRVADALRGAEAASMAHQAIVARKGRLEAQVRASEVDLDDWTNAVKYAHIDRVRATLGKLTEAQAAPILSPRWGAGVFSTQKASATRASDNRDAVSMFEQDGALRVAVADGSSVGQLTGEWARLIASGFTGQLHTVDPSTPKSHGLPNIHDEASLKSWLTPLHGEWSHLVGGESPFTRNAIRLNGGMTTLVGLEMKPTSAGAWGYHASAAGDSNLFVVRKGKIVTTWPMQEAAEFNSSPVALSFLLEKNSAHAWKTTSGELKPGDEVFMTTDALAKWVLDGGAKANTRLTQLSKVTDAAGFQKLVDSARASKMIDDDTTMAHFVVPAAKDKDKANE